MRVCPTRRELTWAGVVALAGCKRVAGAASATGLAELEAQHGGRLGLFVIDAGSRRKLERRADERFLTRSTIKLMVVAAVLARADAGQERLDRRVGFTKADLAPHSPVAQAHVAEGGLTVQALCQAAIEVSDNTAANLLMESLGGPAGVTRFARSIGDSVTRQDRLEPAATTLDGERDTSSPRAMAGSARSILLGGLLRPASRDLLQGWMTAAKPGLHRLRAGAPKDWRGAEKAGTGRAETNDVAILWPPGGAPLIVAAFYDAPGVDATVREAVLSQVGAQAAAWRTGRT